MTTQGFTTIQGGDFYRTLILGTSGRGESDLLQISLCLSHANRRTRCASKRYTTGSIAHRGRHHE